MSVLELFTRIDIGNLCFLDLVDGAGIPALRERSFDDCRCMISAVSVSGLVLWCSVGQTKLVGTLNVSYNHGDHCPHVNTHDIESGAL